jgi:NADH dehydrogenase/NADH:ubiquinone oxidoreductase subunit G
MPLAFEQQPRESAKAFAAFKAYLHMGAERSLAAVAAKLDKHVTQLERWSAKFDWPARVLAYSAHLAMIERQAIEGLALEKAIEWGKVHEALKVAEWQRHKKLIALADEMIARWEKNEAKCGTLEGIARVLELATKLGRLAAGLPTEVKEVTETRTTSLRLEWAVALKKVYGQPATVVEVAEVGPKKELAGVEVGADRTESHQSSTAPETSTSAGGTVASEVGADKGDVGKK